VHKDRKDANGTVSVFLEGLKRISINELLSLRRVYSRPAVARTRFPVKKTPNSRPQTQLRKTFRDAEAIARNSDDCKSGKATSPIPERHRPTSSTGTLPSISTLPVRS